MVLSWLCRSYFDKGQILEQGLTGNSIKDRDGAFMLDAVKDQFGNVVAGKLRRGLAHHGVVARDLIRFGVFTFAVQFEDAMLDALGLFERNTDKIDNCARPSSNQ